VNFFESIQVLSWGGGLSATAILSWFVGFMVIFQGAVVLGMFISFGVRRFIRRRRRMNNQERESTYLNLLMEFALHTPDPKAKAPLDEIQRLLVNPMERGFFKRIMMQVQPDLSRESLHELYRKLKFLDDDIRKLKSRKWWKNIQAVLDLEQVSLPEAVPLVHPFVEHSNDVLALSAMRAVVAFVDEEAQLNILESLSRRAPDRKDLFFDVLNQIGLIRPELVRNYCLECYDPEIAAVCLEVLRSLGDREASGLAKSLLQSSDPLVLKEAILLLGKISTSVDTGLLIPFLKHSSSRVREASLQVLNEWGYARMHLILVQMEEDPSYHIRRRLFAIAQERAAL